MIDERAAVPEPGKSKKYCAIVGCAKLAQAIVNTRQGTLRLCRYHEHTVAPPRTMQEREREALERQLRRAFPIGSVCWLPKSHPAVPKPVRVINGREFEVVFDGT